MIDAAVSVICAGAAFAATLYLHEAAHFVALDAAGARDLELRFGSVRVGDSKHVDATEAARSLAAGPVVTALQAMIAGAVTLVLARARASRVSLLAATWLACTGAAWLAASALAANAGSDVARLLDLAGASRGARIAMSSVGLLAMFGIGLGLRGAQARAGLSPVIAASAPGAWALSVVLPVALLLPRDVTMAAIMGMFTLATLLERRDRRR